ncbi:hypothetical protein C8P68_105202 [Mucilaginibacter yixingensis]|uniref:Uncharacterized protein n=1 Tax=Mucilaginibacter yixingensis TaxID=1295612 RepID=A0A2T5J8H6_9SPHI|nr:hypothetical protein [Mucilaginibacter yixingensis]PTQ95694.1 hypothetical protein C8P68_105202 [Mucilaginibacter yixingensis]
MDKYTKPLIIACIIVFGGVGFILLKGCLSIRHDRAEHIKQMAPTVVSLNTSRMRAIYQSENDTIPKMGAFLIKPFLCRRSQSRFNDTLWADAYLCAVYRDSTRTQADTVLVLDTDLQPALPDNPENFYITIDKTPVLPHCRIVVPKNFRDSVKRYPYRYGRVGLWID